MNAFDNTSPITMKNISEHITYQEAIVSATGKRLGIKNDPPPEILKTMEVTAEKLYEPVRNHFGVPFIILSFFRSPELNKAVGGAKSSQHMPGEAIDVQGTDNVTNAHIFNFIKDSGIEYDQIIWEFGTDKEPDWVHMSYTTKRKNRRQALRAIKRNGKTVYEPY